MLNPTPSHQETPDENHPSATTAQTGTDPKRAAHAKGVLSICQLTKEKIVQKWHNIVNYHQNNYTWLWSGIIPAIISVIVALLIAKGAISASASDEKRLGSPAVGTTRVIPAPMVNSIEPAKSTQTSKVETKESENTNLVVSKGRNPTMENTRELLRPRTAKMRSNVDSRPAVPSVIVNIGRVTSVDQKGGVTTGYVDTIHANNSEK